MKKEDIENEIKLFKAFAQLNPFTAFLVTLHEEYEEKPREREKMMKYLSEKIKEEIELKKSHLDVTGVELLDEGQTADGYYYRFIHSDFKFQILSINLFEVNNINKNFKKREIELVVNPPISFKDIYFPHINIPNSRVEGYKNSLKVKINFNNREEVEEFNVEMIKENKIIAVTTW